MYLKWVPMVGRGRTPWRTNIKGGGKGGKALGASPAGGGRFFRSPR